MKGKHRKREKRPKRKKETIQKQHSQKKGRADKKINLFVNHVEKSALEQFYSAMDNDFAVAGVLLPDAHTGYTLPIGAVVGTEGVILPSWVGYDIGCGMCAVATGLSAERLSPFIGSIYKQIYQRIPTGFNHHDRPPGWDHNELDKTDVLKRIFDKKGLKQLGTLGSGNHFIEIGSDENSLVWIVVHSGSRGTGHTIATHYMKLASGDGRAREGHYGFDTDSENGRAYINDMNFCLAYALENRKRMITSILEIINETVPDQPLEKLNMTSMINRNHNHAEFNHGMWIHRKGATQADKKMQGVIPGNMRDGSFIIEGLGNPESLWSSSHGAGRVLGRRKAKQILSMDDFRNCMGGIKAKVTSGTLDESPFAYKDIFKVLENQKDMIKIHHHIKPIINIKA